MVVKKLRPKFQRDDQDLVFDEDQRSFLNSSHTEKQIVLAGPGAGKTTVAIQRVVDLDAALATNQDASYPFAVLFLSFSKASIQAAAESMSTDLASLNVEFQAQTIDSLAYEICRYDGQMSLAEIEQTDFADRLEIAANLSDQEGTNLTYDLRHVFVDEAQDVSVTQAKFLKRYLSNLPEECGVTIFADPDQEIYRFLEFDSEQTPRWEYFHQQLKDLFTWEYFTFNGRYRAQSIFMRQILDGLAQVRSEPNRAKKTALLDKIQTRLPTITLERLADTTESRAAKSAVLARTNASVTFCFDYLRRAGYSNLSPVFPTDWQGLYPSWIGEVACSIPANEFSSHDLKIALEATAHTRFEPDPVTHLNLKLRRQMTWEEIRQLYETSDFHRSAHERGRLTLSTIHQSKGLEFDDVAILDPGELLLRSPVELEVLFVALSRARNMTYSVVPPDDYVNFRTRGRRLLKYRYVGKRRILTHISILPGDISLPAHLGAGRAERPIRIERDAFLSFEPILSRTCFSYYCTVNGDVVGETTEEFGRLLRSEARTEAPPNLGSVPMAGLSTQFVPGPSGIRPILVPIPFGISEVKQSQRT